MRLNSIITLPVFVFFSLSLSLLRLNLILTYTEKPTMPSLFLKPEKYQGKLFLVLKQFFFHL